MSEDHGRTQEPVADPQDPREEYMTPALTDLGSFQELTQLGASGNVDAEGMS
ncbi:MAG TPA: lasso RiPP family leader peptide-containing protein [Thermoleophilaceae bacterium]|jgi:hypothetical protein